MRDLLTLYKMLWEQIKDKKRLEMNDVYFEANELDLEFEEPRLLLSDIIATEPKMSDPFTETGVKQTKSYVKRRIKELE